MSTRLGLLLAGIALSVPLSVVRGAAPRTEASPDYGLDAPLLEVDRFSDAAGTLLRRSAIPSLPAPNAPIDLDASPFAVSVETPGGAARRCYDLDVRPVAPARYYVFYDRIGNYQLGQFPIVDVAPGDPGYSDLWDIWKVIVPDGFRPFNAIRDASTVERLLADPTSGYAAYRTGILLNGPIVPEGSRAGRKADDRDGSAALLYAWYRGKRAPYLYFEGSLRAEGESAPVSEMRVLSAPSGLPLGLAFSDHESQVTVGAAPKGPGYSPLHRVVGANGGRLLDGWLNCPVVGKAP